MKLIEVKGGLGANGNIPPRLNAMLNQRWKSVAIKSLVVNTHLNGFALLKRCVSTSHHTLKPIVGLCQGVQSSNYWIINTKLNWQ